MNLSDGVNRSESEGRCSPCSAASSGCAASQTATEAWDDPKASWDQARPRLDEATLAERQRISRTFIDRVNVGELALETRRMISRSRL